MSDPRYDPAFQRDFVEPEVAAVERVDAPRRRNPWLAVLWVVGAVLLALGVAPTVYYAVLGSTFVDVPDPSLPSVMVLPRVVASLAPWLIIAGVAAVVGAVFIHARDWRD